MSVRAQAVRLFEKKYSYVVIAKMSHRLTETKETLFRTNIARCLEV